MKHDPKDLASAADRAEQQVADCDAAVSALEAEQERIKASLEACLTGGAGGTDVRALADQRDAVALKRVSRRQDAQSAQEGAKAARASPAIT